MKRSYLNLTLVLFVTLTALAPLAHSMSIEPPKGYFELIAELTSKSPQTKDGRFYKKFKVKAQAGKKIQLVTRTSDLNLRIEVFFKNRLIATIDGVPSWTGNRHWTADLEHIMEQSGSCKVIVSAINKAEVGEFSLQFNPDVQ